MPLYKAVKAGPVDGVFRPLHGPPDLHYEVGGRYEVQGPVMMCGHGFHACKDVVGVFFPPFGFSLGDPVLEVAMGSDNRAEDGVRVCSGFMEVLRVMSPAEVAAAIAGPRVIRFGDKADSEVWFKDGLIHRDGGLPAVRRLRCSVHAGVGRPGPFGIYMPDTVGPEDITLEWFRAGQLHRDGGPARVHGRDWCHEWYRDGKRHRDGDMPAIECRQGRREWWRAGVPHRDHGRVAKILSTGDGEWWADGKFVAFRVGL
jgi:hypothetical protein